MTHQQAGTEAGEPVYNTRDVAIIFFMSVPNKLLEAAEHLKRSQVAATAALAEATDEYVDGRLEEDMQKWCASLTQQIATLWKNFKWAAKRYPEHTYKGDYLVGPDGDVTGPAAAKGFSQ